MEVSGYERTGMAIAAGLPRPTRFRIAPARHLTIGPNWGENQSGDESKSRPFVYEWINKGSRCENWEGLYVGDPIGYWSASPSLDNKGPWAVGIPWADAVAHGELVITQQWGARQGAAGALPGGPVPGFQHAYQRERWVSDTPVISFAARKIGLIAWLPGDYPIVDGVRQRPPRGALNNAEHLCRIPRRPPIQTRWNLLELQGGYPVPFYPEWSGSPTGNLGRAPVGATIGEYWHYDPAIGKRGPLPPEVELEMGSWQELSTFWVPTGKASPEPYVPSREDYIYPWVATHGSKSCRFPLSLRGLKKLPRLDAKSKGWLLWGAVSEPGFTFEPEGYEQTGNEHQSKICSELQLPPNFPGVFSAGSPETGSMPSGED